MAPPQYRQYPYVYNDELLAALNNIGSITTTLIALAATIATIATLLGVYLVSMQGTLDTLLGNLTELRVDNTHYHDQSLQGINNINDSLVDVEFQLTDIKDQQENTTDILADILTKLNALSNLEKQILGNLSATKEIQENILEAIGEFDMRAKVTEIIDTTTFNVNCPSITGVGFDAAACEYDPLGIGPINCDGIELEEFDCEAATLTAEEN
jgi:hypothetical protein